MDALEYLAPENRMRGPAGRAGPVAIVPEPQPRDAGLLAAARAGGGARLGLVAAGAGGLRWRVSTPAAPRSCRGGAAALQRQQTHGSRRSAEKRMGPARRRQPSREMESNAANAAR